MQDRFGSYGLTGVMVFRVGAGALVVDTFLLSCRALGRGVEHRMVARLGEIAVERGLARVEIPFVAGQRNRPAALFLESLGESRRRCSGWRPWIGGGECSTAGTLLAMRSDLRPERNDSRDAGAVTARRPDYAQDRHGAARRRADSGADSRGLAARRTAPSRGRPAPRTPLERDLAELWAGLLNLPAVGIHDNFFELGGHSLLAVQLLSRVRQIYGVELSLEVVYSSEFTVAELAKAVELKEIEQAGGDYQELLQELEGMSDEEARALLAEEQDAT